MLILYRKILIKIEYFFYDIIGIADMTRRKLTSHRWKLEEKHGEYIKQQWRYKKWK